MAEQKQEVEETTTQGGGVSQNNRVVSSSDSEADQKQVVQETTTQGDGMVKKNRVVTSSDSAKTGIKIEMFVYFLLGLLEAILAFRVVLSLLGANRGNSFAELIYSISYPFVAPFFGLFGYEFEYGVSRFEIETLVAMAVYALVAWGIAKLLRISRA